MTVAPDPEMLARAERYAESIADRLCVYIGIPPRGAMWDHEYHAARKVLLDALAEQREADLSRLAGKVAPANEAGR